MTTYLVTGGAGFIGSHFVHHLLETYDDVTVVNVDKLTYAGNLENLADIEGDERHIFAAVDIADSLHVDRLFTKYDPTYVVNFAAESCVDRSIDSAASFADTNVRGTLALLEVARADWEEPDGGFGKHRFLQVSTDEVYGSLPLRETDLKVNEQAPISPNSPYAASKAAADMFVLSYGATYGMPVQITRGSNCYGPNQFPEKLIPRMISCALKHETLPVYGDGENVRDWMHVRDYCRAIDLVLHRGRLGEVYNVGAHEEHSNIEIVERIACLVASLPGGEPVDRSSIEFVADRPGHDRRYAVDASRVERALGWQPQVRFDRGLENTVAWYLDHRDWLEHIEDGSYKQEAKAHDRNAARSGSAFRAKRRRRARSHT